MNNMNLWAWNWIDAVALAVTALCAVLYLADKQHSIRSMRTLAITLVAGCAFGRAMAYFWPGNHDGFVPWLRLGMDLGMCSFFVAVARGQVARLFEEAPLRSWHVQVLQACEIAHRPEDWELVRRLAVAALRRDSNERRLMGCEPAEREEQVVPGASD